MIIIDAETSGLDERENCLLSIGAVEYETGEEFYGECRVYEESIITPEALAINGFTYEQARDRSKKLPHELVFDLYNWSMQLKYARLLAGQQVGSFDIKFIKWIFDYRVGSPERKWPFGYRSLDLHSVAYAKFHESLSLDGILIKLGMNPEQKPHNALTGATLETEAFKRLLV
jgi:DNA polymerase III epsilon subunit-like protein